MKYLNKALVVVAFFNCVFAYSQEQKSELKIDDSPIVIIADALPEISKDSTKVEIIAHVEAMIAWMTEEHYKSNFTSTLIYGETALHLAKKTEDSKYVHSTRSILGNTMLRVKDTSGAKALFLKSLKEANEANDKSAILGAHNNLANVYYYTFGYKHKLVENYLEMIELAESLKDTTRLFVIHHNLARAYYELEQPDNSSYHIDQTETYLNSLGNPTHYQASHLHNQGKVHLLNDKPYKAIAKFKQTIALCENTDYIEALIEGYEGYKEALEVIKDYKELYFVNKKLEIYEVGKKKDEAKNITDAVTAKLTVARYKDQIKSKELEKELLEQRAKRKNYLFILVIGLVIFLVIILLFTYFAFKNRKALVKDLQIKNKQYLIAKDESEQLTKAKAKFFATVSHELRTPLYGVIGLSSILLENNDLKKHEKDLKSLKFSANYLLALINDLLQMNKIENTTVTEEESTFNIKDLTSTIVSSFEYIRLQHQNRIKVKIDDNVPRLLKGNSVRLSQILMNLIGNACKFTEKGVIKIKIQSIESQTEKTKLQFTVSDTGPGIEQHKLNQIFDEFTQIKSSSSIYQGTGLGLPIVKKLVEQARGQITVLSEIGKGTMFTFNIEIATPNKSEEQIISPVLDFKQLKNKHVLVVEDNRINQTVTKRILENSGVICEIAQNGEEAIVKVKEQNFDLILMDINMPVKNGIEATIDIRRFNEFIPIIALTAVEIEEQKYQIFESGMNDIILKPYDIDQFKKIIIANLITKQVDGLKKLA